MPIVINMDGISPYVRVDLVGTATGGQSVVRLGTGEWAIDGSTTNFAAADTIALTFTIYVSQQTGGVPLNNVWDFTISEASI